MKLEPFAWHIHPRDHKHGFISEDKNSAIVCEDTSDITALYAIPEGYVVVPVSLLKRANTAMMEWAAKYGEHNPQWLPPARVSELSAEIEAMIAAKEQS